MVGCYFQFGTTDQADIENSFLCYYKITVCGWCKENTSEFSFNLKYRSCVSIITSTVQYIMGEGHCNFRGVISIHISHPLEIIIPG